MPSRAARTLLCAALLAGSAIGVTTPAQAEPAVITGHVTDAVTGEPVHACLSAISESTWDSVDTCTDDSGTYSLPTTGGDGWVVSADAAGYAHQYARGHYDWNSSDRLSAPGTADFAMVRASAVHARLRETTGDPAVWAWVELVDPATGEQVGSGSSDDGGALDVSGVRAGDVLLHVSIGGRDVWLGGDGSRAGAHTYNVAADAPLDLGDVTLPAATRIVGRLTDATGAPVSGVCADATTGGWGWGCSNDDGRYAVEVAPGANLVHLVSQNPDFASVWVGGAYAKASASTVTAVAHTDVVANQVMPRGARLAGRALDSDGKPVAGACPMVHLDRTPENAVASGDCSGPDGAFHIASVPTAKVTVSLTSPRGVDTWAPGKAVSRHATVFRPVADQTTQVGDVRLVAGKVVTGRVVDAVTGGPVPDVWVTDGYAPRAGGPVTSHAVQTDANGEYELADLSGDQITLVAWDMSYDYAPTFSGDAPTVGRSVPVRLAAQPVTADFALRRAGVLQATVTAADGSPLPGTWVVDAYGTDRSGYGTSSDLYPAGDTSLTIRGLPEAPMKLKFYDPDSHQTFWYGGTDESSAQAVRVPSGQTVELTITRPAS